MQAELSYIVYSVFFRCLFNLVIQLLVQLADLLLILMALLLRNANNNGGGVIVQNWALLHGFDPVNHVGCGALSLWHILS